MAAMDERTLLVMRRLRPERFRGCFDAHDLARTLVEEALVVYLDAECEGNARLVDEYAERRERDFGAGDERAKGAREIAGLLRECQFVRVPVQSPVLQSIPEFYRRLRDTVRRMLDPRGVRGE